MKIRNLQWDNREEGATPLRQVQLTSLRLLRVLDAVAKEIGVEYFLMYGTLLGARRHGGFIPWDDDIDVVMVLDDYEKFQREASRHLPEDVFLMSPRTEKTWHCDWVKLVDAYSSVGEEGRYELGPQHRGISIDIFCWYNYRQGVPGALTRMLLKKTACIDMFVNHRFYRNVKTQLIGWLMLPFNALLQSYWRAVSFCHRKTGSFGMTPNVSSVCRFVRYDRDLIYPLRKIVFEGLEFPAPHDVDRVMALRYGDDFMTPPPVEKRLAHNDNLHPFTPCNHPRAMPWPKERHE